MTGGYYFLFVFFSQMQGIIHISSYDKYKLLLILLPSSVCQFIQQPNPTLKNISFNQIVLRLHIVVLISCDMTTHHILVLHSFQNQHHLSYYRARIKMSYTDIFRPKDLLDHIIWCSIPPPCNIIFKQSSTAKVLLPHSV